MSGSGTGTQSGSKYLLNENEASKHRMQKLILCFNYKCRSPQDSQKCRGCAKRI